MSTTYPDVEEACRTYLRSKNVAGQRVFFGVPKQNPQWPLVTVRLVGGGGDPGEAPLDVLVIQFACWGRTKDEAFQTVQEVRSALSDIQPETAVAGTVLYGANTDIITFAPDPSDDRPRYIVTTTVTARAA